MTFTNIRDDPSKSDLQVSGAQQPPHQQPKTYDLRPSDPREEESLLPAFLRPAPAHHQGHGREAAPQQQWQPPSTEPGQGPVWQASHVAPAWSQANLLSLSHCCWALKLCTKKAFVMSYMGSGKAKCFPGGVIHEEGVLPSSSKSKSNHVSVPLRQLWIAAEGRDAGRLGLGSPASSLQTPQWWHGEMPAYPPIHPGGVAPEQTPQWEGPEPVYDGSSNSPGQNLRLPHR